MLKPLVYFDSTEIANWSRSSGMHRFFPHWNKSYIFNLWQRSMGRLCRNMTSASSDDRVGTTRVGRRGWPSARCGQAARAWERPRGRRLRLSPHPSPGPALQGPAQSSPLLRARVWSQPLSLPTVILGPSLGWEPHNIFLRYTRTHSWKLCEIVRNPDLFDF